MSSTLSLATHDGATFTRRDGGRFSMRVEKSSTTGNLLSLTKQQLSHGTGQLAARTKPVAPVSVAGAAPHESKELTAWKRRKEYDARKSVADAKARSSGRNSTSSPSATGRDKDDAISAVDEIAMLSNAVAYNLNVLSQSTQSEAITLVRQFSCWLLACLVCVYMSVCVRV
jgi:hypothetical protein